MPRVGPRARVEVVCQVQPIMAVCLCMHIVFIPRSVCVPCFLSLMFYACARDCDTAAAGFAILQLLDIGVGV